MTATGERSTIALVLGRKHCGKTHLMRKMIEQCRQKKSVLVIDKLAKYKSDDSAVFFHADRVWDYLDTNRDRNVFATLNSTDEGHIHAAIIAAYLVGNISIFYDEADTTFGQRIDPSILEVVLRGRNQGIDLILSALRPMRIGIDTRNQADQIYCFKLVAAEQRKAIFAEFGMRDLDMILSDLDYKDHEYLKYDVGSSEVEIFTSKKSLSDREAFFKNLLMN